MSTPGYIAGDFWRICDRCGVKVRSSQSAKEWTGFIVCRHSCYDSRHPQDFVRGVADQQAVSDPRPEAVNFPLRMDLDGITIDDTFIKIDAVGDSFIDVNEITEADL